ncbi:hypothetical protein PC39_13487 [Salinisphaera sp. PC39]|uniref:hypothetical protein n=1 Tax=Salinisphaera sp. PC39 TaxID=1304156 RepID=UPI003341D10A
MSRRALALAFAVLVAACDGGGGSGSDGRAADLGLTGGAGPDGRYYAAPAPAEARHLPTRWPVVLSHAWSRTADGSFQGDRQQTAGEFNPYGVKNALEAEGVAIFQPDKVAYASHERRGRILYKKCAGATIDEILCRGEDPEIVDGIHLATIEYCADPTLRRRHGFDDEAACRRGLRFNIICHSQGCPDSRYMMAAVRNEFSGELMYKHVASWTSMAGANKGTAQADWALEMLAACVTPGCRALALDLAFGIHSLYQNQALITRASESVVALSRHYTLFTTDMECDPRRGETCPPSFNERYPLPEDPDHPVLYQTFTSEIRDIDHPCYQESRLYYEVVKEREGPNDGNISVESQRFTTYGPDGTGGATPVIPRWYDGATDDPAQPHPGLSHMAASSARIPGIDGVSCAGEDNSAFHFSRIELFKSIVGELAAWGY